MQATQTVPSAPAVLQFPKLCDKAQPITQAELAELIEFRNLRTQLEERIAGIEAAFKGRLESGASVESGILRAFVKAIERRSVAWKQVCERELGEDYCRRVLAATKPATFTHLVVEA